jgi:hypothetical protein
MAELPHGNRDAEWLGAQTEDWSFYVAVFVPSEDRDGTPLDHEYWRNEAVRTLSMLFGGATSIQGFGGWLDVEQDNTVLEEAISVVFSFFEETKWNKQNVSALKKFLHRMGREAKQGAIGLYVMGKYLEIPSSNYE